MQLKSHFHQQLVVIYIFLFMRMIVQVDGEYREHPLDKFS